MASMPKTHQGFGQIFKWDDKKWHVDSKRFLRKRQKKFGKKLSYQRFDKNLKKIDKRDDKKGASWKMAIITEMANLATIHLRFAKIKWNDKRGMLTGKFGENSEFGKQ